MTAVEHLDRSAFCEVLAELLAKGSTSARVISLEGEWGEGKTTAIETVIDLLGRRYADLKPFVVRVTPWKVGGSQDLVQYLLSEFAVMLPSERKRIRFVRRLGVLLGIARYADALAAAKGEPSTAIALAFLRVTAWIANRFWRAAMDLDAIKENLGRLLKELGRPIIVFVDDVDRLLPEEVLSVMRFSRAVGDFPGVTYVLAYDQGRITESLERAGVPSPTLFLDKIVSMRFHLPPASREEIRNLVLEGLSANSTFKHRRGFEGTEDRQFEILDYYLAGAITTPRAVERVLAKLDAVPDAICKDVEFWDLVGMSTLSVLAPEVFDLIRTRSRFFVGEWSDFPDLGGSNDAAFANFEADLTDAVNCSARPVRRYIDSLVRGLFPYLDKASTTTPEWLAVNGRVGGPRGLYAYLRMALGSSQIPLSLVDAIVAGNPGAPEELKITVDTERRMIALLALVDERLRPARPLDSMTAGACMRIIVAHWGWLMEAECAGYSLSRARPLVKVCSSLLQMVGDAAQILFPTISDESTVALGATLLDHSLANEGRPVRLFPKLSPSSRPQLANRLATTIESGLRNAEIPSSDLTGICYALKRVSISEFEDIVRRMSTDAKGRRRLISVLGATISSLGRNDVAYWPPEILQMGVLQPLVAEADLVIEEQCADKLLKAAAIAMKSGRKIVIESGLEENY